MKIEKRYVGIKELSRYCSLPVKTLYEWAGTGRIPSIKIGSRRLFDLHDIDKIMQGLKCGTDKISTTASKIICNSSSGKVQFCHSNSQLAGTLNEKGGMSNV